MTNLNYNNRGDNSLDDTIVEMAAVRAIGILVTLDYPSLASHGWDDELLPSGD